MKAILTVGFILLAIVMPSANDGVLGKWITIDDETGERMSVVEIYKRDGKVFGKIVEIFLDDPLNSDPKCTLCPKDDPRHGESIVGMEIIKNLSWNGSEYSGGTVLKPDAGEIYRCKIWVEKGDLKIRGYWGIFYRTQTWKRYKE